MHALRSLQADDQESTVLHFSLVIEVHHLWLRLVRPYELLKKRVLNTLILALLPPETGKNLPAARQSAVHLLPSAYTR